MRTARRSRQIIALVLAVAVISGCGTSERDNSNRSPAAEKAASERQKCDQAIRVAATSLQEFWTKRISSELQTPLTSPVALSAFEDLEGVIKSELERRDCAYTAQFSDLDSSLSRLHPDSVLLAQQIDAVTAALEQLSGVPRQLASSDRKAGAVLSSRSPLSVGDTAHTPYFDVTVLDHLTTSTAWAVEVRVCYTHANPGAKSDGTTRISEDPWSFALGSGAASTLVKINSLPSTEPIDPLFRDNDRVALGQCQVGWMSKFSPSGAGTPSGVRYNPRDFDVDVRWEW